MAQARSRIRRSRQEWRAIVQEWKSTGQTASAFASSRSLNVNTLKWWHRELNTESDAVSLVELLPRPTEPKGSVSGPSMIEVVVGEQTVRLPATCGPVRAALLVAALLWAK